MSCMEIQDCGIMTIVFIPNIYLFLFFCIFSDDDFENPMASLQSDDCHELPVVSLTNTDNSAEESKNEAVVPNISKPVRKRLKLGNLLKPIVDTSDTDDDLPQFLDD